MYISLLKTDSMRIRFAYRSMNYPEPWLTYDFLDTTSSGGKYEKSKWHFVDQ